MSATTNRVQSLIGARLRAAIVVLVAAVAFMAITVGDAGAAGWSNPFVSTWWAGPTSVPTTARVSVNCNTVYRSSDKVWRVRAYLNITNGWAGDVFQTNFALVTEDGFRFSQGYTTRFSGQGNLNNYVLFEKTWYVSKSARPEAVVAQAAFWRNGVYGGTEYASLSTSVFEEFYSAGCTLL
jgi:hypothetical protein